MENNLKNKTRKGLFWSATSNFVNKGVQFIFSVILARLLSPSDYGIVGMISIFICIVSVFVDSGFSQALIVKKDRSYKDISTVFFFNIVVSITGYFILFFSSPFIAHFYDMPILSSIVRVVGLGLIINSFCVVQNVQCAIRLDFKTPALIGTCSQILSGVIGLYLAYLGYGVWALVFQQLAGSMFNVLLLWFFVRWIPFLSFSKDSLRYLWNYGSKILGTSLIQQVYDNLYPLLIGKFYSPQTLGLYSRAQGFASLPSTNLSSVLGQVTFPILSKINDDNERLIVVYRRMIRSTAFVSFPMMFGMAAVASPMVKILLNEQWYSSIILLQILCTALVWQPLSYIHLSLLKITGRTDILFRLEVIKRVAGIISILASLPLGIMGICIGYSILYLFTFFLNTVYICSILHISLRSQIQDIMPTFLCSTVMGVIVYYNTLIIDNHFVSLGVSLLIGFVIYFICAKVFLTDIFFDVLSFIKKTKK